MKLLGCCLIICLGVILFTARCSFAQSTIECSVSYKYQDQRNAIREQQWEEGWSWEIEGPIGTTFTLSKATSTTAIFETRQTLPAGLYVIAFKNNKDQCHSTSVTLPETPSGQAIKLEIVKYYNKVILKNRNNQTVTGSVYFSISGITDFNDLKNSGTAFKCPPAPNRGYSFPSIKERIKSEYSIYVPDSKNEFREVSFQSQEWYGTSVVKEIRIE